MADMGLYAERDYRLTITDFDRYGRLHPACVLDLLQDVSEVQVSEMGMGVDDMASALCPLDASGV